MIRLTSVYKEYPRSGTALRDVTLHVNKGELVFLTGHSGAGKSTILRLIQMADLPSAGEVRVSGFSSNLMRRRDIPQLRRKLGVVFQDFRLLRDRTAEENVAFALEVTGTKRTAITPRVNRLLTQVGLSHKARAYPDELSGGERQRVAVARALANEPLVLLADEPTGNLDEWAAKGVFELFREINSMGMTVLMATHDLALVRAHPEYRVVELAQGAVVYDSAAATAEAGEGLMPYALREAFAAFRRTPLLAALSVIAIAFALFVIGLFGLTAFNIRRAIEKVEEKVEIVAYLTDEATPAQVEAAQAEVRALPQVASLRYVNKTEALATAMAEMEEFKEVFSDLDTNPLPASFEVSLKAGSRSPVAVERVAKRIQAYPFVEDVRYGRDWLNTIYTIRRIAAGVAMVIGGAFALVAAIVIATAVRITVFARREEIGIMRLVGATDGFVQSPFLLEGLMSGLLGGLLAAVLTWGTYRVLGSTMFQVEWLPSEWIVLTVLAGTGFGLISSLVAVRRHLGQV